jgi:WD40 repeat protein
LYRGFTNPKSRTFERGFRISLRKFANKPISSKPNFPGTLSSNGNFLATASGHSVLLWDVRSGSLVATFNGAMGWISRVHFSEDDNLIVAEFKDGRKTYWWNDYKGARALYDKMAGEIFAKVVNINTIEVYEEFLKIFPYYYSSKVESILKIRTVRLTRVSQAKKTSNLTQGFTSPFKEIQKQTQLRVDKFVESLTPPPIVPKPQLPAPPPKLVKDQFETLP